MGTYINNSSSSKATASGGVGFCGLLFIALLVLKLTHVIDWSWWWITAPLWGGFALFIILVVVLILIGAWLSRY
jgi:hypothetical protein